MAIARIWKADSGLTAEDIAAMSESEASEHEGWRYERRGEKKGGVGSGIVMETIKGE